MMMTVLIIVKMVTCRTHLKCEPCLWSFSCFSLLYLLAAQETVFVIGFEWVSKRGKEKAMKREKGEKEESKKVDE